MRVKLRGRSWRQVREKLRRRSRSSDACSMTLSMTSQGRRRDMGGMFNEYLDDGGYWTVVRRERMERRKRLRRLDTHVSHIANSHRTGWGQRAA